MASLLTTFLAAFILAYVLRPLFKSLVGLGAHKTVSAFLTVLIGFLGVFGLMLLFLSVLQKELPALRQQFLILYQLFSSVHPLFYIKII
jgi:predicted PurR-regulated permease PerM